MNQNYSKTKTVRLKADTFITVSRTAFDLRDCKKARPAPGRCNFSHQSIRKYLSLGVIPLSTKIRRYSSTNEILL